MVLGKVIIDPYRQTAFERNNYHNQHFSFERLLTLRVLLICPLFAFYVMTVETHEEEVFSLPLNNNYHAQSAMSRLTSKYYGKSGKTGPNRCYLVSAIGSRVIVQTFLVNLTISLINLHQQIPMHEYTFLVTIFFEY